MMKSVRFMDLDQETKSLFANSFKAMNVNRETKTIAFLNHTDFEIALVLGSSKYVKRIKWWKKFKITKTFSDDFSDFLKEIGNNE